MSDETPDWVAALDQMRSGLADFAKIIRAYYQSLIGEGFTPDQALVLTASFQAEAQRMGRE